MNNQGMIIESNAINVLRLFPGQGSNIFSSLDLSWIADNKTFWKTVKPLFSDNISHRHIISLTDDGKTCLKNVASKKRGKPCFFL